MSPRLLASCAIGLLLAAGTFGALALSGPPRSLVLLRSSFDSASATSLAEIGRLDVTQGKDRFDVVADPSGNHEGVYDDTQTQGEIDVVLDGTFHQNKVASQGTLCMEFDLLAEQLDSEFDGCFVVDNPSSELYPVGGADGNGGITLGHDYGIAELPLDTPVHFTITVVRPTSGVDWKYSASIQYSTPGAFPVHVAHHGTIAGSAGKNIKGVRFLKKVGTTGVFKLDDIVVAGDA